MVSSMMGEVRQTFRSRLRGEPDVRRNREHWFTYSGCGFYKQTVIFMRCFSRALTDPGIFNVR